MRKDRSRPSSTTLSTLLLLTLATTVANADEGDVTATLGGRLHWDFGQFENDRRGAPNVDDTEIRRLALEVSGKLYGLEYTVEGNFADLQDDFSVEAIEAWDVLVSKKFSAGKLTVGQFKQHFTLDDRISSNYGVFLERSLFAQTLAPLYRLGAGWLSAGDAYTIGGSVYSLESIDEWQIKGRAFGGRGTWAPMHEAGRVLHLGLSAAREYYDHPGRDGAPALRIRPRPAGHLSDASRLTLVSFGSGRDTDVDKTSIEFAAVRGPFHVQSEIGDARFDDGGQSGRVDSAYAAVGWFITGESLPYDRGGGRFGRVKPNRSSGAWQLALRYDTIRGRQNLYGVRDFSDTSIAATTAAVNWHLRSNLRFLLDWTSSRNYDHLRALTLDRTQALTGRFQYDF
ncbi:porin [Lysobacter sp. S4-A87]|uniref:OprO/OprP family phosphate-selective porin n=1 Tax=Lysobacter sp. S4-A87 TaxID=2925843 RepID=UPI001F53D2C2|nr:porin [Lysobacter sp. S4-A87]UNK48023.1 porin [Lysobacter sp. S4-A87]